MRSNGSGGEDILSRIEQLDLETSDEREEYESTERLANILDGYGSKSNKNDATEQELNEIKILDNQEIEIEVDEDEILKVYNEELHKPARKINSTNNQQSYDIRTFQQDESRRAREKQQEENRLNKLQAEIDAIKTQILDPNTPKTSEPDALEFDGPIKQVLNYSNQTPPPSNNVTTPNLNPNLTTTTSPSTNPQLAEEQAELERQRAELQAQQAELEKMRLAQEQAQIEQQREQLRIAQENAQRQALEAQQLELERQREEIIKQQNELNQGTLNVSQESPNLTPSITAVPIDNAASVVPTPLNSTIEEDNITPVKPVINQTYVGQDINEVFSDFKQEVKPDNLSTLNETESVVNFEPAILNESIPNDEIETDINNNAFDDLLSPEELEELEREIEVDELQKELEEFEHDEQIFAPTLADLSQFESESHEQSVGQSLEDLDVPQIKVQSLDELEADEYTNMDQYQQDPTQYNNMDPYQSYEHQTQATTYEPEKFRDDEARRRDRVATSYSDDGSAPDPKVIPKKKKAFGVVDAILLILFILFLVVLVYITYTQNYIQRIIETFKGLI